MAKTDKPGVFISYSQHDEAMMRKLVAHLSMLNADLWHDRKLVGGDRWAEILDERLDNAEIILLVVSHHFLSSNFCMKIELQRALEREQQGETIIIPVIISDCDWENSPVSQFQILPTNRKAIESWERPNEAFKDVVNGIRKAIESIRPQPESSEQPQKRIPKDKLPYLCDRSDQEDQLAKRLKPASARPAVCLVHGDVREAHSEFLDRLKSIWLPNFLKTKSGVKRHLIEAPGNDSTQSFWGKIGKAMADGYPATKLEVWPYIARHAEPLMLVLNLRSSEVGARGEALIRSLLKFCNEDWDDLPADRFVIFFICVKYEVSESSGWFGFKKKSPDHNLRAMIDGLAEGKNGLTFSDYSNLTGLVLPELTAIKKGHVDEWSQKHHPLPDKKIRDLFDRKDLRNSDGDIPMESLAEELTQLMDG